jgi:hypothetical protein
MTRPLMSETVKKRQNNFGMEFWIAMEFECNN